MYNVWVWSLGSRVAPCMCVGWPGDRSKILKTWLCFALLTWQSSAKSFPSSLRSFFTSRLARRSAQRFVISLMIPMIALSVLACTIQFAKDVDLINTIVASHLISTVSFCGTCSRRARAPELAKVGVFVMHDSTIKIYPVITNTVYLEVYNSPHSLLPWLNKVRLKSSRGGHTIRCHASIATETDNGFVFRFHLQEFRLCSVFSILIPRPLQVIRCQLHIGFL